jgi:protein SCO1/2
MMRAVVRFATVFLAALSAASGQAQPTRIEPARDVGFDQKLGEEVPLDLVFRDEGGGELKLGDLFGKKPVLLSLVYFQCPMLCGMATEGLIRSLKPLAFTAGKEFDLVTVSFDPRESSALAAAKKQSAISEYGREGAAEGWRFLTGDQEAISRLTRSVGFRYVWDAEKQQFAHPTGIVTLTPKGRISKYLFGIEYPPRDLRLGLIEAADERIGSLVDQLLLLCYRYDPSLGRYTLTAINLVRGSAVLTVGILLGSILLMLRRERRRT